MELFPARQLNVMQSEILANGKSRLWVIFMDSFYKRPNLMQKHGLILLPALIRLIIVSSVLIFQEAISIN